MNAIERLRAVLCAPDGTVSIHGSDGDRAIIHDALTELDALTPAPQVQGDMVLVPEGWVIERTAANEVRVTCNGDVSVMAREGGAYTGSLAEYALYGLVSDMLSAAPSAKDAEER